MIIGSVDKTAETQVSLDFSGNSEYTYHVKGILDISIKWF